MTVREVEERIEQGDRLVADILGTLARVEMDSDTRAKLELELLELRIQLELIRKVVQNGREHCPNAC